MQIRLDEAIEGIIDAYNTLLTEDTPDLLDGATVVRGDRARPTPKPPSIWIFPMTGINNQSASIREDWELPVQLVAVVKNKDPNLGYFESFQLASRARSVILTDRKLGLSYVGDTISKSFSTTESPNRRNNLYAHYALLQTRFMVLE